VVVAAAVAHIVVAGHTAVVVDILRRGTVVVVVSRLPAGRRHLFLWIVGSRVCGRNLRGRFRVGRIGFRLATSLGGSRLVYITDFFEGGGVPLFTTN
jgi:hypothetical protein